MCTILSNFCSHSQTTYRSGNETHFYVQACHHLGCYTILLPLSPSSFFSPLLSSLPSSHLYLLFLSPVLSSHLSFLFPFSLTFLSSFLRLPFLFFLSSFPTFLSSPTSSPFSPSFLPSPPPLLPQVLPVVTEMERYGGERTGIRANLTRSIKIK